MTVKLYATYAEPAHIVAAVRLLKGEGFAHLEAFTPHDVDGLAEALELGPSRIPMVAFVVGLLAAAFAYFIEWLLNAYLYPINVGARPPYFPLSYVPIAFEVGILTAALTAVFGVVIAGRLGRLWTPVFEVPGFESASRDRYWLQLGVDDAESVKAVEAALLASGATEVMTHEGARCAH